MLPEPSESAPVVESGLGEAGELVLGEAGLGLELRRGRGWEWGVGFRLVAARLLGWGLRPGWALDRACR